MTSGMLGQPVLIIGAGHGGSALLEMFLEDKTVTVLAIADSNPHAPGLILAGLHGIPVFHDAVEAMEACRHHPDCIVYNLTHDDAVSAAASRIFGGKHVASGPEVKLFWQIVTRLKQTQSELKRSQEHLQAIIQNVMDGIITINERGEIQGFNPAAERIFGYTWQEVQGRNVSLLMPELERSAYDDYIQRYMQTGRSKLLGVRGREMRALRKDGSEFPMELSASEMWLDGQRYFIGIVRDISERKEAEEKIQRMAHYDYLTNLPNRALFFDILGHSLALARRNRLKVAVLFLDLDGFKPINDRLGHKAGDLLLCGVAARLKAVLRASDTVARFGGDEFVAVLDNIGSHEHAAAVGEKILQALAQPFDLQGQSGQIAGSIGIALFPDDGEDAARLVQAADQAMYLAKQGGKNTLRFYHQLSAAPD